MDTASEGDEVNGLTSIESCLLSELFTFYKVRGEEIEKIRDDEGNDTIFDCSKLSNFLFKINRKHLTTENYGIDKGAVRYLSETLESIRSFNSAEEYPIVPLYVPGDGNCLLHAISRCLVGREIFSDALIKNMNRDMWQRITEYQEIMGEHFCSEHEFLQSIHEVSDDYKPENGGERGLTFVHIFVLAHIFRRPIILLDADMQSNGDYTGLFLPLLLQPHQCTNNEGMKNPPLLIAWSSGARNHYVPLVCKENKEFVLPFDLLPRIWGNLAALENNIVNEYIDFDNNSSIKFGKGQQVSERMIERFVKKMGEAFFEKYNVSVKVVAYYYNHARPVNGSANVKNKEVINKTKRAIEEECLQKCTRCGKLSCREVPDEDEISSMLPEGLVYHELVGISEKSILSQSYRYDQEKDRLFKVWEIQQCERCSGALRAVTPNGDIIYVNGDEVSLPGKHSDSVKMIYWNGKYYEHKPERIDLKIEEWTLTIDWFYKESDPDRNSNAYNIANDLIDGTGYSGNSRQALVNIIVDEVLRRTSHLYVSDVEQNSKSVYQSETDDHPYKKQGINQEKLAEAEKTQPTDEKIPSKKKAAKTKNTTKVKRVEGVLSDKLLPEERKINESKGNEQLGSVMGPEVVHHFIKIKYGEKNERVEITDRITYEELQMKIQELYNIHPEEQVIKTVYPRKILCKTENSDQPVGVKHGDSFIVEKKAKTEREQEKKSVKEKSLPQVQKIEEIIRDIKVEEQTQEQSKQHMKIEEEKEEQSKQNMKAMEEKEEQSKQHIKAEEEKEEQSKQNIKAVEEKEELIEQNMEAEEEKEEQSKQDMNIGTNAPEGPP